MPIQLVSTSLPRLNEWAHFFANGERHPNSFGQRIGTRKGIVEIDEQAIPGKVIERRLEARDEPGDHLVVLAKHAYDFLASAVSEKAVKPRRSQKTAVISLR